MKGKKARFSGRLDNIHAQALQNRLDLQDVMTATQDTIEDVMKVVLATTAQTMRLAKIELDQLYDRRDRWQKEQEELEDTKDWYLRTNLLAAWYALPWWKKLLHWRMRVR